MILSIGHIALRTGNIAESLDFYTRVLGGEKVFTGYEEGKANLVYVKLADGTYVELFIGGTEKREKRTDETGFMHLCLTVDDIFAEEKRIRGTGWPIGAVRKGKYGNYQLWITDPDGNEIELMQILPDFLQGHA